MASILRWAKRLIQKPSPPVQPTRSQFSTLNATYLIEEELLPFYKQEDYYPVRIGEVLIAKYKVLGKLGYGAYSTVWLCRNLLNNHYVAVKVCTRTPSQAQAEGAKGELEIYEHLRKLDSLHTGQAWIRQVYETFEIHGPDGRHACLVHPPMHMTARALQRQIASARYNEKLLRETLIRLFRALDFLHSVANVVHTDIKSSNIMLTIGDASMITDFERGENAYPSPQKVIDTKRTIYTSRIFRSPRDALWGEPVLCDLGGARIGDAHHGHIQPRIYRAPEVIFDIEWSYSVDIWNIGVMIWDLFENKHMFNALDEDQRYCPLHHVAEMVAYLGLPPPQFTERSELARDVFDDNGKWMSPRGVKVPSLSLESSEALLEGRNKKLFLNFVRSMLQWVPEERKTAKDLLSDPWLNERIEDD